MVASHHGQHNNNTSTKMKQNTSIQKPKPQNTLLISFPDDVSTWFQYESSLQISNTTPSNEENKKHKACPPDLVAQYRTIADEVFRREVQLFMDGRDGSSSRMDSTIRKGTLKDRIAAMSLSVGSHPIHNFHILDGLLQMACGSSNTSTNKIAASSSGGSSGGLPNSRVAQLAAEALEDLFLKTLLPPHRKLVTMDKHLPSSVAQQHSNNTNNKASKNSLSPRLLLLWRFEEMVKDKFNLFLRNYLQRTLQDGMEVNKLHALKTAAILLKSAPEQEALILSLLVNKLGDPERKLAAAASHELRSVLEQHPNMKVVIAREVQQLAHRPHLSTRALYNCIAFLNQIKLEKTEPSSSSNKNQKQSLPAALISTYFKFFQLAIASSKQQQDNTKVWGETASNSRLLSALLTGVNRAQPYLSQTDEIINDHLDELYRVVHDAPATASTQALALLFHIAVGSPTTTPSTLATEEQKAGKDRYYRALYSALSRPEMIEAGKHSTIFFNILYKSMKYDNYSPKRVLAMAKRLLCTTLHCQSPSSLAASIYVLNDVAASHSQLEAYLKDVPFGPESGKIVLQPTIREPQAALSATNDLLHDSAPSSWELALAQRHYHPSVATFASTAGNISYDGNPLQDFSLSRFLDKFAYRNPKAPKGRQSQKAGGGSAAVVRFARSNKDSLEQQQQQQQQQQSSAGNKEDHSAFFQRFFQEREKRTNATNQTKKKKDDDEDDVDLYAEEGDVLDHGGWESDPEEEEFVAEVAQKMLEDVTGAGPVDIDDDEFGDVDYNWDSSSDDEDGEQEIGDAEKEIEAVIKRKHSGAANKGGTGKKAKKS